MNKNELMTSLTKTASKVSLKVQKHSPEILLGAGIVGFVGTVVLACKATLKADEVLDHHNRKMKDIEDAWEIAKKNANGEDIKYSENMSGADFDGDNLHYDLDLYKKDKLTQYVKTGVSFGKLYGPTIALGTVSLACILTSRNIMQKRYLGVIAAYNGLSEAFEAYRSRVREEQGEIMDRHFRYGTELEEVTVETVDENGKKKKEKQLVEKLDNINMPSAQAVFFDSTNPNWDPNPQFSMMFLRSQCNYLNDKFHTKGHLFLNEVYDALGFPETQQGAILGWVEGIGDDYIDFGLYDPKREDVRRFVNGDADAILLDFNHTGVMWDQI